MFLNLPFLNKRKFLLWLCRYSSPTDLAGKKIVLFSYGSGLASSMFSITVTGDASPGSALAKLHQSLKNLQERLDSREKVPPEVFDKTMKLREETHHLGKSNYQLLLKLTSETIL